MRRPGGRSAIVGAALVVSACASGERSLEPPACAAPTVARSTVTSGAPNVLSALVTADVTLGPIWPPLNEAPPVERNAKMLPPLPR